MTAWDARHQRERMLMLFIAQGWLPLPLYLRSSQALTYSCSQWLSPAEDGLPMAVLEALGFALGKGTEICSLFPKHLLQITSGKDNLQQGCSPPCYLCLAPWEPQGCTFLGAYPPSPPYQLWHWSTAHAKHHQESSLQKQQRKTWWNIGGRKKNTTPQSCWSTTTFAPALPNTARLRGH